MQLHDDLQQFMYTSGNFFSRKDLSLYMHRVFAEEIEKESVRDQEYASMDMPLEESEPTGLHAFDEIEPVSTVSALNVQPGDRQPAAAPGSNPNQPLPRKSTLLGMQAAVSRPQSSQPIIQTRVPGLVPRAQSIPPAAPRSGVRTAVPQASAQPVAQTPAGRGRPPGLDMEWDDEELSTQIYDKPDDLPLAAMARGPQPSSSSTGSLPPVLISTPGPGQHAPVHPAFAQAAQQGHSQPQLTAAQGYSQPQIAPAGAFGSQPGQPPMRGTPDPRGRPDPTINMQDEAPAWHHKRQGKPMLLAIVAVVAIVAVIALGLVVFEKSEPGSIHLATAPRNVLVTVDGRPASASTSPFVLDQLAAGVTHDIEVTSPGYRSWSSKVELQPGQTMELPTVTLDRIESGFALDSVPAGATVFVDGRRIATATPVRTTDMEPGDHQIRLEHEGYAPWESALHVTSGTVLELQTASLKALAPEPSVPAPVAPRQAAASGSGGGGGGSRRSSGGARSTPSAVSSQAPVYRPQPEEPAPQPAPEPRASGGTGTLRVNTRPWSKVFVDGRLIGNTPQMNVPLDAGRHTVTLVNDDFGIRKTIKVDIKAGEVETQVLTLTE
jgi:hypothetical protein